jgi:outer membrane protein assembly factor BamB
MIAAFLAALAVCAAHAQVMGTKPSYAGELPAVANEQAIVKRIWVPGADDGFVPQGLTVDGGYILVSAYQSADPKVNAGQCRVFRVEAATGKDAGSFDLPVSACTHSGGLAYLGKGMLLLADTRQLHRIDLEKALATGHAEGAMKGSVKLAGALRGSYAAFDGKDAWIGTWTKEAAQSKMYRLDARLFDDYDGRTVKEDRAVESLPVPLEAQGLAFDRDGNIWISASNGHWGYLYRLERKTGAVKAKYDVVLGIEDIEFAADGHLWAVSESGSRKYQHWPMHFPLVFEIDVAKLK